MNRVVNGHIKEGTSLRPDHGKNYVPGSEIAPENLAPQPLDHFKRGYKERAELRDREMSHLNMDFEHSLANSTNRRARTLSGSSSGSKTWQHPSSKWTPPSPSKHTRDDSGHARGNKRGHDRVSDRGTHSMGFEVNDLVDRLSRPGCSLHEELNSAKNASPYSFESGKAITAILSTLARRREMTIALSVWKWMEEHKIVRNVFHFNSLISVCEKMKKWKMALQLLGQMDREKVKKNEVTFSSAISACEKAGQWKKALDLLTQMKDEGVARTAICYNAAISACEKGLKPNKALEIFEAMKKENIRPTVITYSALISACEKGQQWKLALEVLDEMKAAGHGANIIAYSAAISALSKGQQWEKALDLFREIEQSGSRPSVVTYNAMMTALEKSLQWERALDLFDEMKFKKMPVTVVSFGSAISACEKGYQWRQCLLFLDEMIERRIPKNVIIFGAAMSCMEKSCRADIAFQLMERMKTEGVNPNVHIYNSAISACARCGLWERGIELFEEMDKIGVAKDVVTYNAVLDAVSINVPLARRLFKEGVEKGFYARVSRLGTQWLELDLHFLSLGGGEIALGWWFEECLVPYLGNHEKLAAVKSIDIVTGYGKTRMRGARQGDDGMRKRVRAMLRFMNVREIEQSNKGRIHIDKEALKREVGRNNGKIIFNAEGYRTFRREETTANAMPNVPQVRRNREGAPPREDYRDQGSIQRVEGSVERRRNVSHSDERHIETSRVRKQDVDHSTNSRSMYDDLHSNSRKRVNPRFVPRDCSRSRSPISNHRRLEDTRTDRIETNHRDADGDYRNTKNERFVRNSKSREHSFQESISGNSDSMDTRPTHNKRIKSDRFLPPPQSSIERYERNFDDNRIKGRSSNVDSHHQGQSAYVPTHVGRMRHEVDTKSLKFHAHEPSDHRESKSKSSHDLCKGDRYDQTSSKREDYSKPWRARKSDLERDNEKNETADWGRHNYCESVNDAHKQNKSDSRTDCNWSGPDHCKSKNDVYQRGRSQDRIDDRNRPDHFESTNNMHKRKYENRIDGNRYLPTDHRTKDDAYNCGRPERFEKKAGDWCRPDHCGNMNDTHERSKSEIRMDGKYYGLDDYKIKGDIYQQVKPENKTGDSFRPGKSQSTNDNYLPERSEKELEQRWHGSINNSHRGYKLGP